MTPSAIALIIVGALLLVVAVVVLLSGRSSAAGSSDTSSSASVGPDLRPAAGASPEPEAATGRRLAVVYNPTKLDDVEETRARIERVCREHGWQLAQWIETTAEDPGTGQAREALARGVDMVCPLGGDGTVRAVAVGLLDSEVPMGLLPGGTGNLLARNLELPIDSIDNALAVALGSSTVRHVDVGTINVIAPGDTQDQAIDHFFLVMAGLGFDAEVMSDAPEKLKAHVGWAAYVMAGLAKLNGPRFGVDLTFDGQPRIHRRVRTVLVGNCGKLQGGVALLPRAEVDDGVLDTVMLSPRGVVGWASVAADVVSKHHMGHRPIEHKTCRSLVVRVRGEGQEVQLDGDPIGPGRLLTVGVRPGALAVKVA